MNKPISELDTCFFVSLCRVVAQDSLSCAIYLQAHHVALAQLVAWSSGASHHIIACPQHNAHRWANPVASVLVAARAALAW
jgi:hypothetical protein